MPDSTIHNTGNIFTITLTSNQKRKKHIYSRPHDDRITITLYFSTTRRHHLLLLLLTGPTMLKNLILCCCCIAAIGGLIAGAATSSSHRRQDDYMVDHMYPLKTFFIRTSNEEANKMSHKLLQGGSYHDFLEVHQIRSRACYGWNVVLKVTTDNTHFFNSKTAVWPTRPEFEWIANALNNDLSSIYYIHYLTYTIPPNMERGGDEDKGKLAVNDLYCDTTSISVDLRDRNDDSDKNN